MLDAFAVFSKILYKKKYYIIHKHRQNITVFKETLDQMENVKGHES